MKNRKLSSMGTGKRKFSALIVCLVLMIAAGTGYVFASSAATNASPPQVQLSIPVVFDEHYLSATFLLTVEAHKNGVRLPRVTNVGLENWNSDMYNIIGFAEPYADQGNMITVEYTESHAVVELLVFAVQNVSGEKYLSERRTRIELALTSEASVTYTLFTAQPDCEVSDEEAKYALDWHVMFDALGNTLWHAQSCGLP